MSEMLLFSFDKAISKSILDDAVRKMSMREFKTRAGIAVGRALVENRRCVQAGDFEVAKTPSRSTMRF